ncbi:acetyltransferase [Metapseudomonas lalkuanensis]|uniref:acetyltransferase n=1 Tax=Metapseudomonas lalkuanensis TaxID=2604832 RepID=UPI001CF4AF04|nr:acetyltransferase [Pseudomonas lalkuanensis]UCO96983.1 acetyltransferase [Pseudomonas lalkuanensis]
MLDHCAFNGDADGLCALQQLRLAGELAAGVRLVSGVKRDIGLLDRVQAGPGERVTVLDISHEQNRTDVARLLDSGARVRYFDHHFAGELPGHPAFESFIDPAADVCTSLLVDRYLTGRFHRWAVVAAFGDGMAGPARALAERHGLDAADIDALAELGELLNYNAYGDSLDDLHFDPLALAAELAPYDDPLDFIGQSPSFARLREGYGADMAAAARLEPWLVGEGATLYRLPAEPWARRVSGVLANQLAARDPRRALGLLSARADGDWTFSLRVAADASLEADAFCRGFATGGGRKRAAGINHLPAGALQEFADRFLGSYQ